MQEKNNQAQTLRGSDSTVHWVLLLPLTAITLTTWIWSRAGVPPPCGSGLGCALTDLRFSGIVIRPADLAVPALLVPWMLFFWPTGTRARPLLLAGAWVQAWFAVTLQVATWRLAQGLCPYCVAITAGHVVFAAVSTSPKGRFFSRSTSFPAIGGVALLASVWIGWNVWQVDGVRNRPIDLDRLSAAREIPEALVLHGLPPVSGREWLAIVDPDCRSCDGVLKELAERLGDGDQVKLLLYTEGQIRSGGRLLDRLFAASPTGAASVLKTWPSIRQAADSGEAPSARAEAAVRRQDLRARSLAVKVTPVLLVRPATGDSPYQLARGTIGQ